MNKWIKFCYMNEETGGDGSGSGDTGEGAGSVLTDNPSEQQPEKGASQQQEQNKQDNAKQDQKDQKDQKEQKPVVPEKYEIAAPEGFEQLDQGLLDQFTPIAKECGLTNEQAQKLANLYGKQLMQTNELQEQEFFKQRQDWVNELKNDPEFGAGNDDTFKASVGKAQLALKQFGSPELSQYLQQSGLGDNVYLVKTFAKIGAAMGEDGFVDGNGGSSSKRAADILFDGK